MFDERVNFRKKHLNVKTVSMRFQSDTKLKESRNILCEYGFHIVKLNFFLINKFIE